MLLSLVASHDITSKVTPLTVECPAPTVDTSQSIKPTTQELGEPRDEAKPVGKTEDSHLCALDTETTEDNTKVPPELLGDSALIECINENTSEAHETVMTSESCTAENAITPIVTGMDHESNTAQKEDITPRGSSNELISKSTSSDGTMVDQVRALSFSLVAILASLWLSSCTIVLLLSTSFINPSIFFGAIPLSNQNHLLVVLVRLIPPPFFYSKLTLSQLTLQMYLLKQAQNSNRKLGTQTSRMKNRIHKAIALWCRVCAVMGLLWSATHFLQTALLMRSSDEHELQVNSGM